MSPIFNNALAGASGQGGAPTPTPYSVDRSLRFNTADSSYLSRTPSTAGNVNTWTWSAWVKRCKIGQLQSLTSSANNTILFFQNTDTLNFYVNTTLRTSTQVFRDPNAWYHIVVAFDTPNATAANRLRIYVNGNEITEWTTNVDVTQNLNTTWNAALAHQINANQTSQFGTLYLADFQNIDGQALDPTSFGEYDSNNVWQPKEYTGTYGTNGFHLDFTNNSSAAALGEDSSGNGNDWTANNLTSSIDILPAVEFGGNSSDYLSIGNDSSLTFGSGDFTIEAWMNFDTAGNYTLVEKGSDWSLLSDNNRWAFKYGNTNSFVLSWTPTFGEWYHVACVRNGSTVTLYIDGQSIGSGPAYTSVADTGDLVIGTSARFSGYVFDGYVSNLRIVKGTALYTSNFTPPTTPLSAVTNTVLLCCQSSTDATDAAVTPGTITANGNVSATFKTGTSPDNDSFIDSPTNGTQTDTGVGGEVVGNYCTLNPLDSSLAYTLSNGNLNYTHSTSGHQMTSSTIAVNSGKWYVEVTPTALGGTYMQIGITPGNTSNTTYTGNHGYAYVHSGNKQGLTSSSSYGDSYAANDVVGIAFDADGGNLYFYKNGTAQNSGTAAFTSIDTSKHWRFSVSHFNSGTGVVNFGQRPFAYTAPSGFKALCTANLPDPTIADGSTAMDVVLYTGNGSTQTISGLGFSPDLVWIKTRDVARLHQLYDPIRGATKVLSSESTAAESTESQGLTSFTSDGFTLGTNNGVNGLNESKVAWTWDAGSSTVTNTDGSITSQVRANASAGFSIVTYTGNGSAGATIGHGLGVAPQMIIVKNRDAADAWQVYHSANTANPETDYLVLNTTAATADNINRWNDTAPTSTVFSLGDGVEVNTNTEDYVAYCWTGLVGYSNGFSYTGNGSTDGVFQYLGFRPCLILLKCSSTTGNWTLLDTAREGYNVDNDPLYPNLSNAEGTTDLLDITSNGFKLRTTDASVNSSGATYVGFAWAELPFKTARAR